MSDTIHTTQPVPKKTKMMVTLGNILGKQQVRSTLSLSERVKQELDLYLHSPTFDIDMCPLEWWKTEETKFPSLAKLAKKYLCVCATSVSSERIFSTGGSIVTDSRTCLKPERVDSLVFLAKNL